MSNADRRFVCPVAATIAVAGGKWKPIIIFHLLDGTKRFGELKKLSGGASQRALTMHLRELEADGIVTRQIYAEVPPRVEYSLTELGRTLEEVLRAMKTWGVRFVDE